MPGVPNFSRRQALISSLLLPLAAGANFSKSHAETTMSDANAKTLVAYFTRTGNTRLIATQIATARNATLFQIIPVEPYPTDYKAQVAQAESERERGYEPQLQAKVANLQAYDTIFLGFPIWGMTAPSIVRSFLTQHDLSGKALVPFITHGGYGLGNSLAVIAEHAPGARFAKEFSKQCDQERETLEQVTEWLSDIEIKR
jgi:flavodoxin